MKALIWFMVLSTFTELAADICYFYHINNYPILHIFTLIEFGFLSYIFSKQIHRVISTRVIGAITILFIIGSILNSIFIQSLFSFNTYARGVEFLIILLYAIILMFELSNREMISLKVEPVFWFTVSVLVYYASSFFVIISTNILYKQMLIIWTIHNVFLLIHYLLFGKALWIRKAH